jgi:hypothetical protein
MQKVIAIFFITIAFLLISIVYACKKNKAPKCDGTSSTYNSNIKSIIKSSCISSGCHPSYATYAGIKSILDNGTFKQQVISNKTMPKGNSLSSDQLNKIQCWVDAGFPEN